MPRVRRRTVLFVLGSLLGSFAAGFFLAGGAAATTAYIEYRKATQ